MDDTNFDKISTSLKKTIKTAILNEVDGITQLINNTKKKISEKEFLAQDNYLALKLNGNYHLDLIKPKITHIELNQLKKSLTVLSKESFYKINKIEEKKRYLLNERITREFPYLDIWLQNFQNLSARKKDKFIEVLESETILVKDNKNLISLKANYNLSKFSVGINQKPIISVNQYLHAFREAYEELCNSLQNNLHEIQNIYHDEKLSEQAFNFIGKKAEPFHNYMSNFPIIGTIDTGVYI
jgi:hypothetical protein